MISTTMRSFRRSARLVLSALLALVLVSTVAAQSQVGGSNDEGAGDPPYRNVEREAPPREPVVLEQTTAADGALRAVIQLPVVADTYIASGRPDQNFGDDSLFLGYNLGGPDAYAAERLLVRFDTSLIPDSAVVNSATVRLYLILSSPTGDTPMGTVLRRLDSSWTEDGVTWNQEPVWTPVDDTAEVGSEVGWYEWQIPSVVQIWVDDFSGNYGLEIIGDERVQQRERVFYARETQTDFFPQLIVDYTVPADDTPPQTSMDPLPDYVGRSFDVSWSGSDSGGSGLDHFDVQYRADGGLWIDWILDTTANEATFTGAANGVLYEFRNRGVDDAGNVEPYGGPEAATTADTLPPFVGVDPLPAVIQSTTFAVSWSGSDGGGSGIQYYDVRYRIDDGPWVLWQSQTLDTSVTFTAATDARYEFEARAVDNRGLVEPFTGAAEATVFVDIAAPFIAPQAYLPAVWKNSE